MSLFQIATRNKFRFASAAGNLTAEDLWDLPLTSVRSNRASLNNVAKLCHAAVQAEGETSFVATVPVKPELTQKLELVKEIIAVKLAENETKNKAAATRSHNAKIDELLEQQEDDAMKGMSREELLAQKR